MAVMTATREQPSLTSCELEYVHGPGMGPFSWA